MSINLSESDKAELFDCLFSEYVEKAGLGGMVKSDFDAFFLWQVSNKIRLDDVFQISQVFKIKESRVKSLLNTADMKFNQLDYDQAWCEIIEILNTVPFDQAGLTSGKISFQLKKITLYRWIQAEFRAKGYATTFNASAEMVTVSLEGFVVVLNALANNTTIHVENINAIAERLNDLINQSRDKSKIKKALRTIKDTVEFVGSFSWIGELFT
jgi:hypothetical protein